MRKPLSEAKPGAVVTSLDFVSNKKEVLGLGTLDLFPGVVNVQATAYSHCLITDFDELSRWAAAASDPLDLKTKKIVPTQMTIGITAIGQFAKLLNHSRNDPYSQAYK